MSFKCKWHGDVELLQYVLDSSTIKIVKKQKTNVLQKNYVIPIILNGNNL